MSSDLSTVEVLNEGSDFPILLTAEHAGRSVPLRDPTMGLPADLPERERNLLFDFGSAEIVRRVAKKTGATAVLGTVSRLVVDLNRGPTAPDIIPEKAHGFVIPANNGLSPSERENRIETYYRPYHNRVDAEIARLRSSNPSFSLFSIHTYTPSLGARLTGKALGEMPDIGVLFQDESCLLASLRSQLAETPSVRAVDNFPYDLRQFPTSSLHAHGINRGIPTLGVEISIDRLHGPDDYDFWASLLVPVLDRAVAAEL